MTSLTNLYMFAFGRLSFPKLFSTIHAAIKTTRFTVEPLSISKIIFGTIETLNNQFFVVSVRCFNQRTAVFRTFEQARNLLDFFLGLAHEHFGLGGAGEADFKVKLISKRLAQSRTSETCHMQLTIFSLLATQKTGPCFVMLLIYFFNAMNSATIRLFKVPRAYAQAGLFGCAFDIMPHKVRYPEDELVKARNFSTHATRAHVSFALSTFSHSMFIIE